MDTETSLPPKEPSPTARAFMTFWLKIFVSILEWAQRMIMMADRWWIESAIAAPC